MPQPSGEMPAWSAAVNYQVSPGALRVGSCNALSDTTEYRADTGEYHFERAKVDGTKISKEVEVGKRTPSSLIRCQIEV